MSDPLRPYHHDPRVGTTLISSRQAQMRCDSNSLIGWPCRNSVARAPVLVVRPKPYLPFVSPAPIRVYNTWHFCERHKRQVEDQMLGELLTPATIADVEEIARRRNWPLEYRPDFDGAGVDWVLVTTPEYRRFLNRIEYLGARAVAGVPIR